MTAHQDQETIALRQALGRVAPETVSQEVFDHNDKHLRRLVRLQPSERAEAEDLWKYIQDLRHTDIQRPLLAYLLPFCLEAWREDLFGISGEYGGFVEHFYPVLADRHIFDVHLTPKQTAAVSEFMRQAILREIDNQRGLAYQGPRVRPYRWIGALTTYGVLLPDLDRLWTEWWSLDTIGRAIASAQYISCLMYPENENPVFAPWTSDGGGGPPCLWGFEGHLYAHRWLEPNVNFLKGTLNVTRVGKVLGQAAARLVDQPERNVAELVQADLPLLANELEARCNVLPRLLETTSESRPLAWP